MRMLTLVLECNEGALRIEGDEKEWCHVWIWISGTTVLLGANEASAIKSRLILFLEKTAPHPDDPSWIVSFAESRWSIYGSASTRGCRLLFQDADGRMVHVLTLGSDEVRSWLEALRRWE